MPLLGDIHSSILRVLPFLMTMVAVLIHFLTQPRAAVYVSEYDPADLLKR